MSRKPAPSTDRMRSTLANAPADRKESKRDIEAELERRNAFLQLLQVVSVAANGAPTSTTHALQTTLDEVCRQTGWTVGHALLRGEDEDNGLVSSGIWHVDHPSDRVGLRRRHRGITFASGVGVPGRVLATGIPEHIADVQTLSDDDADRVRCSLIDEEHMRAVAGFPMMVGHEVCGVLEFFAETPFEADRMLLDVMAQVGMVLGRIMERTRYETALRDAREVAEIASAAKTEFLSRMSHELRTPLTAVLGYAELLEMSSLPEQERSYVSAIEKGGHHLLALINDVLDVARLEKGELRLSVEPVDVSAIVHEVVALMRPLAASSQVTLREERRAGSPQVALGDNQALRQVMLNLVANAIKYNRKGGAVTISIADAPPASIQVDVADTGRGIAAADLSAIFTPFERLGAARSVEGTGLGLGISRQLVDAMGGTLSVRSVVGAGTTLSILLAASERPALAVSILTSSSSRIAKPQASRTVLYVEDNIVNIELMQSFFRKLRPGVTLLSTMLGELAVDLAVEHAPQLILLDVNLPDIDGDEVMRRLKTDERTQAVPVVMVSADAIPSGIEAFLAAGAAGYITKPIAVPELLELVDRAMGTSEGPGHLMGRAPRIGSGSADAHGTRKRARPAARRRATPA